MALLPLRNELVKDSPTHPPRSSGPHRPRPEVPLSTSLSSTLSGPCRSPCFTAIEVSEWGRAPSHSSCFVFISATIYLSRSLPHQNWTAWIPDSCSPFPDPHPSLAVQSFPESLQGPYSERRFQNHNPVVFLGSPQPPALHTHRKGEIGPGTCPRPQRKPMAGLGFP